MLGNGKQIYIHVHVHENNHGGGRQASDPWTVAVSCTCRPQTISGHITGTCTCKCRPLTIRAHITCIRVRVNHRLSVAIYTCICTITNTNYQWCNERILPDLHSVCPAESHTPQQTYTQPAVSVKMACFASCTTMNTVWVGLHAQNYDVSLCSGDEWPTYRQLK